jgi:hypothetical protein
VLDEAILGALLDHLRPKVVTAIVDELLARLAPTSAARDLRQSCAQLKTLDREFTPLHGRDRGGRAAAVAPRRDQNPARRDDLAATISAQQGVDVSRLDRAKVARTVEASSRNGAGRSSDARSRVR